jgi:biotin synthase
MNEQTQALCFIAGANSIFYGEKLLTTGNPEADKDMALFENLGINPEKREEHSDEAVAEAIVTQAVKQEESKLFYEASA